MRRSIAVAVLVAAAFSLAPPPARARNSCMAEPMAVFAGERAELSPDGKLLLLASQSALRVVSFPELQTLARYPRPPQGRGRAGYGFTADKKRIWVQSGSVPGTLALSFLPLGAPLPPALPPPALSFPAAEADAVLPGANFVLAADSMQKIFPRPDSLAYAQNWTPFVFTGRLLRVSDGAVITRLDRLQSYGFAGADREQRHLILISETDPTDVVPLQYLLVDVATGNTRQLPDDSDPKLSPDGSVLALGDKEHSATRFVDTASGAALGTVGIGGYVVFSADSNTAFIDPGGDDKSVVMVRRGNWSAALAVPSLAGVHRSSTALGVYGDRLVYFDKSGEIGAVDAGTLQRVYSIRNAVSPNFSYGWYVLSASAEMLGLTITGEDKRNSFLVADFRTGRVLCQGDLPTNVSISQMTATHMVVTEYDHDYKRSMVYAIEDEATARAKLQRELADARARSAKLAPAKRAEAKAMFKQAFELFRSGEFDAAARLFENGLASDPGNAVAHYYLGETYARENKKDQATLHYQRAAALAPNTKEGALAAARLGD